MLAKPSKSTYRSIFKSMPEVSQEETIAKCCELQFPNGQRIALALRVKIYEPSCQDIHVENIEHLLDDSEIIAHFKTLSNELEAIKVADKKFSGKDAFNRRMLLNRHFCSALTTEMIELIIILGRLNIWVSNNPHHTPLVELCTKFEPMIEVSKFVIELLLLNDSYWNVAFLTHNSRAISIGKNRLYATYCEQLDTFKEYTLPMLDRLSGCLVHRSIKESLNDFHFPMLSEQLMPVLEMINGLTQDGVNIEALFVNSSLTKEEIIEQVSSGFCKHLLPFSDVKISRVGGYVEDDKLIEKIANSPFLIDDWVSHLVFDRLHLMVGLANPKPIVTLNGEKVTFRQVIEEVCRHIDSNLSQYPMAHMQLSLRLSIVSKSLTSILAQKVTKRSALVLASNSDDELEPKSKRASPYLGLASLPLDNYLVFGSSSTDVNTLSPVRSPSAYGCEGVFFPVSKSVDISPVSVAVIGEKDKQPLKVTPVKVSNLF